MTSLEMILSGLAISMLTALVTMFIGNKRSVPDNTCKERQLACSNLVHSELQHIKDAQSEMKSDIKELLTRLPKVHTNFGQTGD